MKNGLQHDVVATVTATTIVVLCLFVMYVPFLKCEEPVHEQAGAFESVECLATQHVFVEMDEGTHESATQRHRLDERKSL
jgi:hypothetical protein